MYTWNSSHSLAEHEWFLLSINSQRVAVSNRYQLHSATTEESIFAHEHIKSIMIVNRTVDV